MISKMLRQIFDYPSLLGYRPLIQATLLLAFLLAALGVKAQPGAEGQAQRQPASWYLCLGTGTGRDLYRDQGSSPLTYHSGLLATSETRVSREQPKGLQLHFFSMLSGGMYHHHLSSSPLSAEAFGANATLGAKALWKIRPRFVGTEKPSGWWANHNAMLLWGCSLNNLLGVKYNTHHENASVGVSEFFLIALHAGLELTWGKCLLHAEANLAPLSACFRPGYAYMDNYTEENRLLATFGKGYEWSAKPFATVGTEIGARWALKSGHRLGCAYTWSYLDTGRQCAWKYQTALHNLKFHIDFKLK